MKKLITLATSVFMAVIVLASCSSNGGSIRNEITIDGTTYTINDVVQSNYGDYYENGTTNIDLEIETNSPQFRGLSLKLVCAAGATRITPGTYVFSETHAVGTFFADGLINGNLKVSLSGDIYTLEFAGVVRNDDLTTTSIKATYQGEILDSGE